MNVFVDIEGYEGLYQVSRDGRIKSLEKKRTVGRHLKSYRIYPERILKPSTSPRGYDIVALLYYGELTHKTVHRIVANAFIPNPKNLPTVNHIDGDKLNNHVDNLEWMSRSDQIKHAFRIGLINQDGTRNPMSRLSETQVLEIRQLYSEGFPNSVLAEIYDVSGTTIINVAKRRCYANIL